PHVRDRDVETVNPAMHGIDQASQPGLERFTLATFLGPDPVRQLRDHDRARVTVVLFLLDPRDDTRVAASFGRLADDVGIEQPAHSLRRRAVSRRRGGTSSMLTGHSLSTASQSSLPARRRKTIASSSASKRASKYSPGDAGANAAGTVRR